MRNYKYVLFDLDGTISDSGRGITNSVKYALRKFGIEETNYDILNRFVGPPLYDSFEKYYGFSKEKAVQAVDFYREYYKEKGIFELSIYDGVIDLLKELKTAGKILILATSKPEVYAEKIAEKFSFLKYFDNISGALLDGSRVKKPDIIKYALERMNIRNTDECVMIGDTEFDVLGAKQFGIDSVGVIWGYGLREELIKAKATYIVDKPNEIKKIIK